MNINNPFGDNYPFIDPPGNLPSDTKYVYDIYVTYYDPELTYKLPLKIISVSKNSLHIVDADGVVVFNDNLRSKTWGSEYLVLQTTVRDKNLAISVIVSKDLQGEYTPVNGDICLRCVYTQPKHITSFEVNNQRLKGDIVFNYGNNISYIDAYTEDFRPKSTITLNAEPGTGLGQGPSKCSGSNITIRSVNGINANEYGDIYIDADECIALSASHNAITARDDCKPCCKCRDFSKASKDLDKTIDAYYTIGSKVEVARDCLLDLTELLNCGSKVLLQTDTFCPVRAYIDTTWERHPAITAEFRNVLPAIIKNLKVTVNAECSPLINHQALRTTQVAELACDDVYLDTQDADNYKRTTLPGTLWTPANSWVIDWTDKSLGPGATVWCTIAARNVGIDAETGETHSPSSSWKSSRSELITVTITATYDIYPNDCVDGSDNIDILECFDGFTINNTHTAVGVIKGGLGYRDYTTKDGDLGVIDRVKKLCMNRYGGKWHG